MKVLVHGALLGCLAVALGCDRREHATAAERPAASMTHFAAHTELFVEFPFLVVGSESLFAAHVTRLDSFKPLAGGRVSAVLSGGDAPEERFEVNAPSVAGIFRPVATPRFAVTRALTIHIEGEGLIDQHDLGAVRVFADTASAQRAGPAGEADSEGATITFLKEQQWRIPFATAEVMERPLRASLRVHGVLRARVDGEARITAPVTGRLITTPTELPTIGKTVSPETVLAVIAPRLSTDTDPAELERTVARARRDLELARKERTRLEALYRSEAIPQRRLLEARHAELDTEADLESAEHRLRQHQGVHRAGEVEPAGRISVRSPIAGILVQVRVAAGEFVEEGRALFDVVDLDRLWLEAHIPEADLARVRSATEAWFQVDGSPAHFEVSEAQGGRLVARGGIVDPESRTAALIFELRNSDHQLAVGMFADVHVLTGETATAPSVPASAVIDDGGESVAYVERGGESFERRSLTLGIRDGELVEVRAGLSAGERVVTRGAYYVRLAAASSAVPAHGHAH